MRPFLRSSSIVRCKTPRELVVLLHGYAATPQRLHKVRKIVETERPNADIFIPSLPTHVLSMADPVAIVQTLLDNLTTLWQMRLEQPDQQPYERITLIGHSIGALFARKLYVYACGQTETGPDAGTPCVWAHAVERIILLGGMNRGWSISSHMTLRRAILARLGSFIGETIWLVRRLRFLILTMRRGAPFITQLRLQWLAMQRAPNKHPGNAKVIQLLGTIDDIVSPDDSVDAVTGANFIYIDVPKSGHRNIVEMQIDCDREKLTDKSRLASNLPLERLSDCDEKQRADKFLLALNLPLESLSNIGVNPDDARFARARPEVTDVIFVIHGIRDLGFWTNKVARRIKTKIQEQNKMEEKQRVVETETSTYGYFAMLPFILPAQRRAKMEWLMDQYTEDQALYPNACFSFVGHSNGTYLLARALQEYPRCRFDRVVFAGSVVKRQYDWTQAAQNKQVQEVVNYVATGDWVVACFPKALQTLHIEDLGSTGHDGFEPPQSPELGFQQVRYIPGSHSAALVEDNWDAIATFIATGVVTPPKEPTKFTDDRVAWVVWAGRLAPLIWVALLAVAIGIGYGIVSLHWAEWLKTTLLIGYLWVLWKILTNV